MPLKLNLTVPNKAVHLFIGLVVVVALVVGVYAYTFPGGFIGHGGDNVWINTTLGETTLQTAIDGGLLGADDDWEKVGGGEPVLADNMYHTGNVGIGTTNPGTNKLEVVGGPIKATGGLIIETRTTNPGSPSTGQMWLCTDPAPYCQ